ncbi:hypothetical protein CHS0354_014038 [Potamilus streckersoni]|uniref:non-specific serine/threonine protein kinase n=1 Tax=Potamilus streckersoni TaxID=2493646 RepID=A0AAE0RUJ4_9BIVA|nr:hypothetical protein CHS0354_014038 [Potamilus streckersoni]
MSTLLSMASVSASQSGQKAASSQRIGSVKSMRDENFISSFQSLPYNIQDEIEHLYDFVPEVQQHFVILDKIGEGTFSSVFMAKLRHYPDISQLFALKHIIPTSHPNRIEGELRCLKQIGGQDNVIGVELCLRNRDHVVIVMPYIPHEKFQDYILKLSVSEVREYMRNLLLALKRVHQFNIIHRDVKPSNFLYNRETKQYALVDFGLAHESPTPRKGTDGLDDSKCGLLSQKKGIFTSSLTNQKTDFSQEARHNSTSKNNPRSNFKQYTPHTPVLGSKICTKKMKSPRRVLLAKRALMVKEKEQVLTNRCHSTGQCHCFGLPQICSFCMARGQQQAPRAGTPGFRSPEVLMRCPEQSTAVDIWSAGVIFLSLLSGRYPFFRASDDLTALAQIISIFGSDEMKQSAKLYGKTLVCSPFSSKLNLQTLCTKLRTGPISKQTSRQCDADKENAAILSWNSVPDSAYSLLESLLDLNHFTRITAAEALKHEFFQN